jgi:hypothetical protein
MEIVNFFETLAGKWFSQRTTHYLANQSSQAGQSDLLIEFLAHTDADLMQLCETLGHDPSYLACGVKVNQDSRLEGDTKNTKTSTLIAVLNPQAEGTGVILQAPAAAPATQGNYGLVEDVLTLTTRTTEGVLEERLWYANPNLRMRTSVVKVGSEVQMASFCSEIRMGLTAPPKA